MTETAKPETLRGMYTVRDFGEMLTDRVRMEAFENALRRSVKPGSVVVDLGAGTGIFTLLACRFGARKVYAIEPLPAIDVVRELVRDNGFRDRVEILAKMSTDVELPERADVIVADLRGVLPLFGSSLRTVIDARSRWLAPGGVFLPKRDTLRVSVVTAPELYATFVRPWEELHEGFDASAARRASVSLWTNDREKSILPEQLLAAPETWAVIDYETCTSTDVRGAVTLTTTRAGLGHGLAVWFDAELTGEDGYSTAPGSDRTYSRAFFPWPSPVPLAAGTTVDVELSAVATADDYVFSWTARFSDPDAAKVAGGGFRQTNFFAQMRMEDLLAGESHRPQKVGRRGVLTLRTLELLSSGASLGEVATQIAEAFPGQARSREEALVLVRDIARKYA